MPAVYIEIIRYAMGDESGSVATLFGREYDSAEARRVGMIHAVTTAGRLLGDAIEMAKAVPVDAFEAFAFSKRALQAATLNRMHGIAMALDEELPGILSSDKNVRARAERYQYIKGHAPVWARD